jgi:hypothetical protein
MSHAVGEDQALELKAFFKKITDVLGIYLLVGSSCPKKRQTRVMRVQSVEETPICRCERAHEVLFSIMP